MLFLLLTLAAAQQWQVQKQNLAQILYGISFVNASTGFVAGDQNGIGPVILRTDDGGSTYHRGTLQGLPLFFTSIAMADGEHGVVVGFGEGQNFHSIEKTVDGYTWNLTDTDLVEESQCVKVIKGIDGGYGIVGDLGTTVNGVGITKDTGTTWTNTDIGSDGFVRYGAFPSPTTWYITSGLWPDSESTQYSGRDSYPLTSNVRATPNGYEFGLFSQRARRSHHQRKLLQSSDFLAEISKTTDGGATWNTVYYNSSFFYLNGIDCVSETECWAVGETQTGNPTPGCLILHTSDGGKTWEEQMYQGVNGWSLVDVAFLSQTEGWAIGGIINDTRLNDIYATYWHTTDGGSSWTPTIIDEYYGLDFSFVPLSDDDYVGWSTAIDLQGKTSVFIYK